MVSTAQAATYTYGRDTSSTDNWSDGASAGWDAKPLSDPATTLVFGGTLAAPLVLNTAGTVISSVNDLSGADVNASGRFELNQFVASYRGLNFNSGSPVPPAVTISGGALEFVDDGTTTPVMALRSNSNSGGTVPQKTLLTVSNDLYIGSPSFKITGNSNFVGGVAGGAIRVTGALNFTTTGTHSIELGGDESTTASGALTGRNLLSGAINDQSTGNATSLTKSGNSLWELTASNGYSGGTTITGGTLRVNSTTGFGTGTTAVSVSDGATAMLGGAGTYAYDFEIAGNGASNYGAIRLANNAVLGTSTNTVTLTGDARIGGNNLRTETAFVDAQITGTGNLTYGTTSANGLTLVISNPNNDYVGNTTFQGEQSTIASSSSTSAQNFRLAASNVIPAGDLTLSMGTRSTLTLELRGFDETVNGLNSAGPGAGVGTGARVITNGNTTGSSASLLTIGDHDADGYYRGAITGSSTNSVALTKIGTGTQVLAGSTTYTGATTVTGGKLTLDYNTFSSSNTNTPTNYFSVNSDVVLNGGTLAIDGRIAGGAQTLSGTLSGKTYTPTGGIPSDLVAGQLLDETATISGNTVPIYVSAIDRAAGTISISDVPAPATTTLHVNELPIGSTNQAFKSLQLAANSTLDFGTNGSVFLTFNSIPTQSQDGTLLTVANWTGEAQAGGGIDQFRVAAADVTAGMDAFTGTFTQEEIAFAGFGTGYDLVPFTGYFEVVPTSAVPEPTSLAAIALAGGLLLRRRRCRRLA
jgi:autotransporter-associated beta strand protein